MKTIIGTVADNPIPLWDRLDILKYLERTYGDDFFINGEQTVKTNDRKDVKLIQMKLESGEYKNLYFGLL